jgi:drug/metabolite transporter (DMT)-like permease
MFSAILGWIFLKEKMKTLDFLGVAFMLGGFFLVSGFNPLKFKFNQAGDILFLIQALLLSINALLIKRLLVKGISGFVIASINLLLTSILFFSFSFFLDYISDIGLVFEGINILLVSALGILVGSNYLFYYSALRNIPIWLVKVLVLFVPILTAILGYLFLSEILTQRHFYGIILTIAGGIIILSTQSS